MTSRPRPPDNGAVHADCDRLLQLLDVELEGLIGERPWLALDRLRDMAAHLRLDIGMDRVWGSRVDERPTDVTHLLRESVASLGPETRAFLDAGLRAIGRLAEERESAS